MREKENLRTPHAHKTFVERHCKDDTREEIRIRLTMAGMAFVLSTVFIALYQIHPSFVPILLCIVHIGFAIQMVVCVIINQEKRKDKE